MRPKHLLENQKCFLLWAAQRVFSNAGIVSKVSLWGQASEDEGVSVGRLLWLNLDALVVRKLWVFFKPPYLKRKRNFEMTILIYSVGQKLNSGRNLWNIFWKNYALICKIPTGKVENHYSNIGCFSNSPSNLADKSRMLQELSRKSNDIQPRFIRSWN